MACERVRWLIISDNLPRRHTCLELSSWNGFCWSRVVSFEYPPSVQCISLHLFKYSFRDEWRENLSGINEKVYCKGNQNWHTQRNALTGRERERVCVHTNISVGRQFGADARHTNKGEPASSRKAKGIGYLRTGFCADCDDKTGMKSVLVGYLFGWIPQTTALRCDKDRLCYAVGFCLIQRGL